MTKGTDMQNHDLDDLFSEARATKPLADEGLLLRVLADGIRLQSEPEPHVRRIASPSPGLWAALTAALGGNRAIAGLGTAAIAGVILGLVQPTSVLALTSSVFAVAPLEDIDLLPGIDAILTEG
jgi:hypothetical protein